MDGLSVCLLSISIILCLLAVVSICCAAGSGGLVWFGYDYRAMIRGPFLRLFNDTPQSMSTSIGLTSGVGTSLKNLTYSCKYSAGETLKVWFARGVIAIASEGNAPNYQFAQWC